MMSMDSSVTLSQTKALICAVRAAVSVRIVSVWNPQSAFSSTACRWIHCPDLFLPLYYCTHKMKRKEGGAIVWTAHCGKRNGHANSEHWERSLSNCTRLELRKRGTKGLSAYHPQTRTPKHNPSRDKWHKGAEWR